MGETYMNKNKFYIILVVVLAFAIIGILYHKTFIADNGAENAPIMAIPIDDVKGITPKEAEMLCYHVLGEKDKDTGFIFSFGTSGAVGKGKKQYYVIRASWLVNNSHLSYIGDFFVSADGKEIYNGTALSGEYIMQDIIWSK